MSDTDLANRYGYAPTLQAPYYLLSCISGLDTRAPLSRQPGLNLSQKLVEIAAGAKPCPRPFTTAQQTGQDTSCIMELVANQPRVTGYLARRAAQIPPITLTTFPSTVVRTGQPTAFVDTATCPDCVSPTRTANHAAGGVVMYATMDSFRIEPYGPAGPDQKTCDGTAHLHNGDTPATAPRACWYRYPRSSNGQPRHAYPFRAVATWSIRILGEHTPFATFHKTSDIALPVLDVQTLVIGG